MQDKQETKSVSTKSLIDKAPYLKPSQLYQMCQNDRDYKAVSSDVPFLKNATLYDLSVAGRGPKQDQVYSKYPKIVKNIRRGNTVLELHQKGDGEGITFARKGLMKFFDISIDFLQGHKYASMAKKQQGNLQNYILGSAQQLLESEKSKVKVYKTLKANGENAQISYNKLIGAWIICSKNVSLAARRKEDIQLYLSSNQQRFHFAALIAESWFYFYEKNIDGKLSEEQVKQFKNYMSNKTIVGEYVGNQEFQHLVKYSRVTVLFYAVIDNNKEDTCIPPNEAFQFFKKYGLDMVSFQLIGSFELFEQLAFQIGKTFNKVAQSKISQQEEGSVLYFIQQDKKTGQEIRTLSLCKLKTLEYRVFRKLREKLRNFNRHQNKGKKSSYQGFTKETVALVTGYELPRKLEYYFEFAQEAYAVVEEGKSANLKLLEDKYIDFCEMVAVRMEKKLSINKIEDFFSSCVLHESKDAQKQQSDSFYDNKKKVKKLDKKQGIILLAAPFVVSSSIMQTLQEWFDLQIKTEIGFLFQESKQKQKVKVKYLSSVEGLTAEVLKSWVVVFYNSNASQNKVMIEGIIERVENQDVPKEWEYLLNPKIVEQAIVNVEKSLSEFVGNQQGVKEFKFFQSQEESDNFKAKTEFFKYFEFLNSQFKQTNGFFEDQVIGEEVKGKEVQEDEKQDEKQEEKQHIGSQFLIQFKKFDYQNYQKHLLVIVPMGLPGLGKTTLQNSLRLFCQNNNISFDSVSSDEIRKQKMNQLQSQKKKMSREDVFQKSGKAAGDAFFTKLGKLVKDANKRIQSHQMILLDKNHPPNVWDRTINTFIRGQNLPNIDLRVVGMIPKCKTNYRYRKTQSTPFSYLCIMQCLSRALKRKNHPTIDEDTDPAKIVEILHDFASYYRSVRFDQSLIKRARLDGVIRLPFTQEDGFAYEQYSEDLMPLSCKIMSEVNKCKLFVTLYNIHLEQKKEMCGKYLKLIRDFSKKVLYGNQSPIEVLVNATQQVLTTIFNSSQSASAPLETKQPSQPIIANEQQQQQQNLEEQKTQIKKVPLFIGIKGKFQQQSIVKCLSNASKMILTKYQSQQTQLEQIEDLIKQLENQKEWPFNSGWKRPQDFHVTCLYMNKQAKNLGDPIYLAFKPGTFYQIVIRAIVIAPKMIITAVVDAKDYKVQNKIAHMTLYTDQLKPVQSNDVLEGIFCDFWKKGQEYEYNQLYDEVMNQKKGGFVKKMKSNMKKKKFEIYLVKFEEPVVLNGEQAVY